MNDRLDAAVQTASASTIDYDPSLIGIRFLLYIHFVSGNDGMIDHHDMFDYVHLTQQGYRKVFELVHVAVSSVLGADDQ